MSLSTGQQVTQQARHYLAVAGDKYKLASGQVARGDTMVCPATAIFSAAASGHLEQKWVGALCYLPVDLQQRGVGKRPVPITLRGREDEDEVSTTAHRLFDSFFLRELNPLRCPHRSWTERSSRPPPPSSTCSPRRSTSGVRTPHLHCCSLSLYPGQHLMACCCAALKSAVTPAQPRRQVAYVINELVKRLKQATDWLVSGPLLCFCHAHQGFLDACLTLGCAWACRLCSSAS